MLQYLVYVFYGHKSSMLRLHKAYKGEENGQADIFLHEGAGFLPLRKI